MPIVAATASEFRQHVLALADGPDPYPFLTVVEDYLGASPEDTPVRALAMRALVDKGLLSVARDLALGCPATIPEAGEMQTIAEQLARAASDLVDWSITDARFAANLEALRNRPDHGAELSDQMADAWREMRGDLTLHKANDGNWLVRGRRSDGQAIWLPAALDFAGTVEDIAAPEGLKGRMIAPFLVDNVGIGCLVPRLRAATYRLEVTYSAAIYVIEQNLRGLTLALRLYDWSDALVDERVFLHVGEDAWDAWRERMERDDSLALPGHVVSLTPWPGAPPSRRQAVLEEITRHREKLYDGYRAEAEAVYAGRSLADWAQRYQTADQDDPLRILMLTSRYTTFLKHSTRDAMVAFEQAGARTRLMIEDRDYAVLSPEQILRALSEFKPDLVFVIDHHRQERPNFFVDNVPYVCWIQDDLPPLFTDDVGPRLGELDFTIGYGLARAVLKHGYPAERFMPCRIPIDPAKFAPSRRGEDDPALRCDVAYVSHHSETPEALYARVREMVKDEHLLRLLDAFYEQTRPLLTSDHFNAGYDLNALFDRVQRDVGITLKDSAVRNEFMSLIVRPLADRSLRHTTLNWVADWADETGRTFHLYGRGWDRHPRFARYARGKAKHGRQLGEISRQAAINLHCGLVAILHQRVLEVVSAGGFLMTRHVAGFNCYTAEHAGLRDYLRRHNITEPVRIPVDELSPEYRQTLQERLAVTGSEPTSFVDVSAECLLEHQCRREGDDRYHYANLAFPDLDRITFDSPASFRLRADAFLDQPEQRREISRTMRQAVKELFTYDSLVSRVIAFVTESLTDQAGKINR